MNTMEDTLTVIEGNRLIAEFMGWKPFNHSEDGEGYVKGPLDFVPTHWLDFNDNWQSLMPVLDKIKSLRDNISDTENGLAYSEISVDIKVSGSVGDNQNPYRVSLSGILMYQRMINSRQHTYDKVEVPYMAERGKTGIEVLYKIIIQFIQWYNTTTTSKK